MVSMFSKTVQITTDGTGLFTKSETSNPPTPINITVTIKATLVSPPNLGVNVTYDINAQDGSVTNPPKQVQGTSGQAVDLGRWNLSHRNECHYCNRLDSTCYAEYRLDV